MTNGIDHNQGNGGTSAKPATTPAPKGKPDQLLSRSRRKMAGASKGRLWITKNTNLVNTCTIPGRGVHVGLPLFHILFQEVSIVANATLICHRGAREVVRDELARVACPAPQGNWRPVPHVDVLSNAEQALTAAGYGIDGTTLALSGDDARFFGTLTLITPLSDGVNLAVGLRSSIDKSIALQWCCGSRVFVCDNLSFTAQTMITRKHTRFGIDRYQEAVCKVVGDLTDYREYESFRIREMQRREVTDELAVSGRSKPASEGRN